MRTVLLWLVAALAGLTAGAAGAAPSTGPIGDKPFAVGEIGAAAVACGLRDKIWLTRLLLKVQAEIEKVDWKTVTARTGETVNSVSLRMSDGVDDGRRTVASDPAGTCARLTPEIVAKLDRIGSGALRVF